MHDQERSCARHQLDETSSVAWCATNGDGSCGTPWQMVAPGVRSTKKVTADKEGAGPPLP